MLIPCEKAQNERKKGRTKRMFAIMVFVYGCLADEYMINTLTGIADHVATAYDTNAWSIGASRH